MLHFGMDMPFLLMSLYGGMMILIVFFLRALFKKKLPKFVFPLLWCVILIRLLVPFSFSSPLTIRISGDSPFSALLDYLSSSTETIHVTETAKVMEGAETAYAETAIEEVAIRTMPAVADASIAEDNEPHTVSYDIAASKYLPFRNRHAMARMIYMVGFVLTAVILLWQRHRYFQKLKNSLLVEHNGTINELLREMDMGHTLVFTNDEIASPLTCGLLSPRIYLPTRMNFQDRELMRHILLHETMHIKRKDNWVKTFMLAALIVNWFNLLVWVMSRYLATDLESACDEAVLHHCRDEEERKNYAFHLLTMAITGRRASLLYSAFSKTEVEKRIQSILHYKKASVFLLAIAVCFMTCSTVAFATCAQAPFSPYLTSSCASDASRWGVKVSTTRSLTLGKDAPNRAENIVFTILKQNTDNDPVRMNKELLSALANEFHVEPGAFCTDFFLCLSDEELEKEYVSWELTQSEDGLWYYGKEPVRILVDEMGGRFYSQSEGTVDITVIRDRFGFISDIRTRYESEALSTGRVLPQPD